MSRTFSTNNGSGDSLKVSLRCGWSPKARQIRLIVARLRPLVVFQEARAPLAHRRSGSKR